MASPQLTSYAQWMTPDATVIYPSRSKLLLLTAGGAVFVVIGFFLLRSTDVEERLAGSDVEVAFFVRTDSARDARYLCDHDALVGGFIEVQSTGRASQAVVTLTPKGQAALLPQDVLSGGPRGAVTECTKSLCQRYKRLHGPGLQLKRILLTWPDFEQNGRLFSGPRRRDRALKKCGSGIYV